MRRFLYYIPGVPGTNPQAMADLGLLPRFTGIGRSLVEHIILGVQDGPAGHGCVVAAGPQMPVVTPDTQWLQGGRFWVGLEGSPPGPGDLARDVGIAGYDVRLTDGCMWQVPLLHRWDADTCRHVANLPTALVPTTADGKVRVEVRIRPEFAAVDAIASRIFAAFTSSETMALDSLLTDAVAVLAVNYRIGIEEAGLLGLLDADTAVQVLSLSIDMPSLRAQADRLALRGLQYMDPEVEAE